MTADPARRGPSRSPENPTIPGYEVEEVIGRGASGVVYRARQLAVDREVALKVLLPELSRNPRIVQRLKREARTTARLAHPNVISAIDMGETDGRWWYAMELVEGGTLSGRVARDGQLAEREALRLFIPLVEALVHLAEHGVVHRDIKPANILLDERTGLARLADLGLAFADDDPERTQNASGTLGTPAFMSPEQAIDSTSADAQSDLWSLGATMFHAVCGRPPFQGASAAEVLAEVLHAPVPDPQVAAPDLSTGFALVLRKCLTRDREQRYRTPRELLADLERVRERRAPRVRRADLEPSPRELQRRRIVLGGLGALGLVALVLLGLRFWPSAPSPDVETPELASYAPLDSLERRVGTEASELLGQHLRELEVLALDAPAPTQGRLANLRVELRRMLRASIQSLRSDVERQVADALARKDFVTADAVLEDVDGRVLRTTGLRRADLDEHGVTLLQSLAQQRRQLDARLDVILASLARASATWVMALRADAGRALDRGDWRGAWELLDVDRGELLRRVGFAEYRFPEVPLDELLRPVEIELALERQSVVDRWTAVDRELVAWIEERSQRLERELIEASGGVFDAVRELTTQFERQVVDRNVVVEELPAAFSFQAAARLSKEAARLRDAEEDRLSADVRAEYAAIERLARSRMLRREYTGVAALWDEVARATERDLGKPGSAWRVRLGDRARRRATAARRLAAVLDRAADAVRTLDGGRVELALAGIPRSGIVVAGMDPRNEGFLFVTERGAEQRLVLETMPALALERLLGWRRPTELGASARLDLALFLYASGELARSADVLRSGPLAETGPEGELVADLKIDVYEAQVRGEDRERVRVGEAEELLASVFDDRRRTHSPNIVLSEIDELLERFSDLDLVRARRDELVTERARLRGDGRRATEEELARVYQGAKISFPKPHRARLDFDLTPGVLPVTWDAGSWTHDGLGWMRAQPATSWNDLIERRGPRLVLSAPLVWTAEGFRVELDLVPVDAGGLSHCLIVSIGGMHVALLGGTLPGAPEFRPRWLVADGTLGELERRLRAGEGTKEKALFHADRTVRLVLTGSNAGGRLTLTLDGVELGTTRNLRASSGQPHTLELRSWEPMRLVRAAVEAGR